MDKELHNREISQNEKKYEAILFAIVLIPRIFYQKVIDPPGDRLLKWQLAGVTDVDPRSAITVILDKYSSLSFSEIIANKLSNFRFMFYAKLPPFVTDASQIRSNEFFRFIAVIGIAWIAMVWIARPKNLKDYWTRKNKYVLWVLLLSIASNCILLFGPSASTIHQSTYSLLLLLILIIAALASYAPVSVILFVLSYQCVSLFKNYLALRDDVVGYDKKLLCLIASLCAAIFIIVYVFKKFSSWEKGRKSIERTS